MQIYFEEDPYDMPIVIEHSLVMTCGKDPKGKILSVVVTGIMTQSGPKGFVTKTSPEEIASRVNYARLMEAGKMNYDASLLGFKQSPLFTT